MSDNDKKNGFVEKHGSTLLWIIAGIGAILALPQDKIVKKFLPAAKNALFALFKVGGDLTLEGFELALNWLNEHWRNFKISVLIWSAFAISVMVLGVHLHNHGYPSGGQTVAVIGALLLQLVFAIVLFASAVFAKILMFKLGLFKQVLKGKNTEAEKLELKERHRKYQWIIFAIFTMFSIALVPFQLFVSWEVLGLTVKLTGLAMPAILIAIGRGKKVGLVFDMVLNVLIGIIILTLIAFVFNKYFPRSLGTIRIGNLDEWMGNLNTTLWVLGLNALGLLALWLYGRFDKDELRGMAKMRAAIVLALLCVPLQAFLMYRGTTNYKDATNHEPPNVSEKLDAIKKVFQSDDDGSGSSRNVRRDPRTQVPASRAGTGVHMAPPSRSTVISTPERKVPSKKVVIVRPAAPKKPLPPPPKAKSYEDDPGAAIADLEALYGQ
ncbi:MAG: hypothetical protein QY323_04640 [Patescibacteria group bacterium]|nr:MAG: hypothetical protein QY323_04640 [Patescibacteria group bacterium]